MGSKNSTAKQKKQEQTIPDKPLSRETVAAPIGGIRTPFTRQLRSELTSSSPSSIPDQIAAQPAHTRTVSPASVYDERPGERGHYEPTGHGEYWKPMTAGHDEGEIHDVADEYWCPEVSGYESTDYDISHFECSFCKRTFRTQISLNQHCEAKGHIDDGTDESDDDEIETPDPPIDSPGQWVLREDFKGRKSFGYFVCDCGRFWLSAHAFKKYKQGCQGCEKKSFPYFLWKNFEKRTDRDVDRNYSDDKPHDASRCEACRNGECIRGITTQVSRVNLANEYAHSDYDDDEQHYDSAGGYSGGY